MMVEANFIRAVVVNFLSALIITLVGCYFLLEYGLGEVTYIGNLFGLYFLVVFGTEILIESGKIHNNFERFVFVIVNTLVFDIVFVILIPKIFGSHVLDYFDFIPLSLGGFQFDLILGTQFYMLVFAVMMLIFNYLLYRIEK